MVQGTEITGGWSGISPSLLTQSLHSAPGMGFLKPWSPQDNQILYFAWWLRTQKKKRRGKCLKPAVT